MPHVYILHSEKWNKYYVGSTDNLKRRITEHERGKTVSTKGGRPWRLMFTYETTTLTEARRIERRIKVLHRRDYVENIVRDGHITLLTSTTT